MQEKSTFTGTSRTGAWGWHLALWLAQILVGGVFLYSAYLKLTTPLSTLGQMMPWTATVPESFVRAIGAIDLAGGLGLLLPALTRILPHLTVWAAVGCVVVQVLGGSLHAWRGEMAQTPLNVLLFALAAFIVWGRSRQAPIRPRA